MKLRDNLNKIHISLINNFKSVSLEEKSSLEHGNYVNLTINEENKSLVMIVSKKDLENNIFNWKYKSNPDDVMTCLVERTSSIEGIIEDIKDIFEKDRFDREYLKKVKK
jgi:tRNA U34 5-carboxymethylaminomethyl modifying GTPase MnmE/TrmE